MKFIDTRNIKNYVKKTFASNTTSCLFIMEYESGDMSTSKHCVNHEKYKFTRKSNSFSPINVYVLGSE